MTPSQTFLCAGVAAAFAGGALADTVSLTSAHDNTLYFEPTGEALSNGKGQYMFAGTTADLEPEARRGLLQFDLSSIPSGATITGASLTLYMSRTISGPSNVGLHRVSASWGEGNSLAPGQQGGGAPAAPGDATWADRFFGTTPWTNLGGDFDAAVSGFTSVDQVGFYTWNSAGMIADLQAWSDGSAGNFGWLLQGDESSIATAKRFSTHEDSVGAFRPALVVEYTIPAPGAAGVLLGALGVAGLRRRR